MKILVLIPFLAIPCLVYSQDYTDLNQNGTMEPYENTSLSLEERAADIVSRMTVDEKIKLVVGEGMNIPQMGMNVEEKVPGAAGSTFEIERLGIPGMVLADGPAGLRISPTREGTDQTYYCTAFPIATLVASSWDVSLAHKIGQAMGNEVKEYGADILLAPAINIHRNPLAGRNFEYFSEDPLLAGKMSASVINGVQSNGVGTSLKHFVANNQETNRMLVNTIVSERALREIYLKGFEIAVKESKPWTIMSSYNQINGLPASQNKALLTTILRDEWGYEGFVMTDWFAGNDAVYQMNAGNDLLMPGVPQQEESLTKAYKEGRLSENALDLNVKRILKILLQTPAFEGYDYTDKPNLKANAQIARQIASEGIVLLKNEGALPIIDTNTKIAAFGIGSYQFIAGGTGSGDVNEAYTVSLVEGLDNASFEVDKSLKGTYEAYIMAEKTKQPPLENWFMLPPPLPEKNISKSEVKAAVKVSDVAFITIGRNSGEFQDRTTEGDFYLTDVEKGMIDLVSETYHKAGKKVIMILNIGNVIETKSWKDKVDAIVLPWQGGQEAGNALVDVLKGAVTPSGKLPTSFPVVYEDVSSTKNFPGESYGEMTMMGNIPIGKPSEVIYEEDIYVGYRYFETFNKSVSFPFGFGKSYTTFESSVKDWSVTEGEISFTASVKNTGKTSGKEIVQVYISAPEGELEKPALELRAFQKTELLKPGETAQLTFTISPYQYSSYDTKSSSWVLEAGEYVLKVGASSQDISVEKSFSLSDNIETKRTNKALSPRVGIKKLTKVSN